MKCTDPTYLRSIYDGLSAGSINKDNATALPIGLVGIYEEAMPPASDVNERKKFMEFFGVWALLKKEVSPDIIALILDKDEQYVQNYKAKYSKWFSVSSSGKLQLYHDRLKAYFIQKLPFNDIARIHFKIATLLVNSLEQKKGDELEMYALEFLAYHLKKQYWRYEDNSFPEGIFIEESFRERQRFYCKTFNWTRKNIREALNDSLLLGDEIYSVKYAMAFLKEENNMISDFEGLIDNIESGNDEYFFEYLKNTDNANYLISIVLFIVAEEERQERSIKIITRIKEIIDKADFEIKLTFIPTIVKLRLAQLAFANQLDFDFIFGAEKYNLSESKHYFQKPFRVIIEHNKIFYVYLINNKYDLLSNELKDSLLYSALVVKDDEIVQQIIKKGFKDFSSKTAEKIAYVHFVNNDVAAFMALLKQNDEFVHFLPVLTIRMELMPGKVKAHDFINKISDRFYRALILAQFAEGMMLIGRSETADLLLKEFNKEVVLDDDLSEVFKHLNIKRQLLDSPGQFLSHLGMGEIIANHVILMLGARKESENLALEFYRKNNLPLHLLNRDSIKKIAYLLGVHGDVDELIKQKRIEKKENYHASGFFIVYEDECALFFLQGLKESEFNEKLIKLLTYLESSDHLGIGYRHLKIGFRFDFLFYLCISFLDVNEQDKAKKIFYILERSLHFKAYADLRKYLDIAVRLDISIHALGVIKNRYINRITWNSEFHLAKIAEDYLLNGNIDKAHFLLLNTNPNKWDMPFWESALAWHKIIERFIKVYLDHGEITKAVELAEVSGSETLEYIMVITEHKKIEDRDIQNKILEAIISYANDKDEEQTSRISQEVHNRLYFENLIIISNIYYNINMLDLAIETYDRILMKLQRVYNADDYQLILGKLSTSVLKNKMEQYYSFILKNINILDRVMHFGISEEWIENLGNLRKEFTLRKDPNSAKVVEDKLTLIMARTRQGNSVQDNTNKNKSVIKVNEIYIGAYGTYSNLLFNTDRNRIIKFLIRYSANFCFEKNLNSNHLTDELSMLMDLKKWKKLGKTAP